MYGGISIPKSRMGKWLLGLIVLGAIALTIWVANSAANPSLSDVDAKAQATQRGFQVTGITALMDQSQQMSVLFGRCAATLFLGGGHGNKLVANVQSGGLNNQVTVDNPTVAGLRQMSVFRGCFTK